MTTRTRSLWDCCQKGFLPFAPDGGDDRGDIKGLRVGIKIVVQRVVANIRVGRKLSHNAYGLVLVTVCPPSHVY
jgi:hypothetical protein